MFIKKVAVIFFFGFFSIFASAQSEIKYVEGDLVQGPFKTDVIEGGELSIIKTNDMEFPVSLVLNITKGGVRSDRVLVDKYDVAGPDPKIESLFFYPIKGKKNVFVLVSWELTSRGIGTYGTLYQVHAYEKNKNNELIQNKIITLDNHLSGIEGYQEGEEQHFSYKDAASIKRYVIAVINK
ncbi:hypothetical protein [Pseudomonas syringae]|uniref:hypothetical protein n=1 Tax=Pseudomonas syringae TaxID=317 RepID=UPI000CDB1A8B|nr:hypothetical protein [Pseudomonas syringae]POR70880.1 hypothetical protein BKM27_07280 [Pseudomonas syringae pv. syringae]POR79014.1 hypothetical protein BKM30_09260 [Pseudomonas syringae pv. syringae]